MTGKIMGLAILLSAVLAGGALYYLQVYGFYEDAPAPAEGVRLVAAEGQGTVVLPFDAFQAIDADSSPIRYRACFTTPLDPAALAGEARSVTDVTPRNAPGWFDCFDAEAIAGALDAGTARTFIGTKNVHYGVDRIVAITDDGRGYIWHELNDCGEKAYDGTVVGEECPPVPGSTNP